MIAEELVDFRRRQHGRRFVENEQAGVEAERFEDLDALALADRQPRDFGASGVEIETIARGSALARRARMAAAVGDEGRTAAAGD